MGAALIGLVLGMALGAGSGSLIGALAGGALGMLLGGALSAVGRLRSGLRDATTVEQHTVMCFPYGQAADCEFVGDTKTRRWYGVRRCSLLRVPTEVDCDKGCIRLINLARVRPGHAAAVAPRA